MITYQDLRDWIATNKGEEVAGLLDTNVLPMTKNEEDTTLSEKLLGSFLFCATLQGQGFWWSIYDELVALERSQERNSLAANENDESGRATDESE